MNETTFSQPSMDGTQMAHHHYEQLTQQLTQLQGDLTRTVTMLQAKRSENDTLQSNFDKMKQEWVRMRSKYNQARQDLVAEVTAKEESDKQHEQLIQTWRTQVGAKEKEFEEIRAQLEPPQDADMMRISIQEELESIHSQQMQGAELETEKFREMFFNIRREHEMLKTQFEQSTIDQVNEAEAAYSSYRVQNERLVQLLQQAEMRADDAANDEEVRALRRDKEELAQRMDQQNQELEEVHREKVAASIMREKAVLDHIKDKGELLARIAGLEADLQGAERQVNQAEGAAAVAVKELGDEKHARAVVDELAARHKAALDQRAAEADKFKSDAGQRMAEQEDSRRRKEASLAQQVQRLREELLGKGSALEDVRAQMRQQRDAAEAQQAQADDDGLEQRTAERQHNRLLEEKVAALQKQGAADSAVHATQLRALQAAKDAAVAQLAAAEREREGDVAARRGQSEDAAKEAKDASALKGRVKEAEEKQAALQAELCEALEREREVCVTCAASPRPTPPPPTADRALPSGHGP
jgi:hypothetical protein